MNSIINHPHVLSTQPWGTKGLCITLPHTDDPSYVVWGDDGLIRVWWCGAHVDEWKDVAETTEDGHPPVQLINTTTHHVYADEGHLHDVITYWCTLAKLPA